MSEGQGGYGNPYSVIITQNTEKLLLRRATNDFRVHFAHHILFEEHGIRDQIKAYDSSEKAHLRVARPWDFFAYVMVADNEGIKNQLEYNLNNIGQLRAKKELQNLKRIWVITYDYENKKAEEDPESLPATTVYLDPSAEDINKIIKSDTTILGIFIILEYDNKREGYPNEDSSRIEWTLLSPGDTENIKEYEEMMLEKEAENLERLFSIRFRA